MKFLGGFVIGSIVGAASMVAVVISKSQGGWKSLGNDLSNIINKKGDVSYTETNSKNNTSKK